MTKRDDEQHPCVNEVSKAVAQVQSDCYSETGKRLLPTKELSTKIIAVSHVQTVEGLRATSTEMQGDS